MKVMYLHRNKVGFALAKGSGQYLVEHPIVSERAPSHLYARYGVVTGCFLRVTITMTPTNKFHRVMKPRLLPKVSLYRGSSIMTSCETALYKYHGARLSRSPESCHSSIYCRTSQVLENLQERFLTVHVEGAREL